MTLHDLSSLITILAIILAGAWTLFRFGISREQYPKLQFDLSLNQLGLSRDKHIVELIATITNKGLTRQYITDFTFNILYFDDNTTFDLSDSTIEKRLKFNILEKGLNWENPSHKPFVDGGMSRDFTYVTAFDSNIRFVMIYSKFRQESKQWFVRQPEVYHITKTFSVQT